MSTTPTVCADCGVTLDYSADEFWWTGRKTWFDPDQVDGTPDGRDDGVICPVTTDPHYPVAGAAAS